MENNFKNYEMSMGLYYPTNHKTMRKGRMFSEALLGGFSGKASQILEDFLSEKTTASDIKGFTIFSDEVMFKIGDKGNDNVFEFVVVKFKN